MLSRPFDASVALAAAVVISLAAVCHAAPDLSSIAMAIKPMQPLTPTQIQAIRDALLTYEAMYPFDDPISAWMEQPKHHASQTSNWNNMFHRKPTGKADWSDWLSKWSQNVVNRDEWRALTLVLLRLAEIKHSDLGLAGALSQVILRAPWYNDLTLLKPMIAFSRHWNWNRFLGEISLHLVALHAESLSPELLSFTTHILGHLSDADINMIVRALPPLSIASFCMADYIDRHPLAKWNLLNLEAQLISKLCIVDWVRVFRSRLTLETIRNKVWAMTKDPSEDYEGALLLEQLFVDNFEKDSALVRFAAGRLTAAEQADVDRIESLSKTPLQLQDVVKTIPITMLFGQLRRLPAMIEADPSLRPVVESIVAAIVQTWFRHIPSIQVVKLIQLVDESLSSECQRPVHQWIVDQIIPSEKLDIDATFELILNRLENVPLLDAERINLVILALDIIRTSMKPEVMVERVRMIGQTGQGHDCIRQLRPSQLSEETKQFLHKYLAEIIVPPS